MGLYYRQMSIWHVLTICTTSVPKLCVTVLLYMEPHLNSGQPFEYNSELSPAWRFVVTHFRWTRRLQSIADSYLRLIFDVPDYEPIPPVSSGGLISSSR
jgi:hypothetical protein